MHRKRQIIVSRDRLENPIIHKLDSFQAAPKKAIIKEKNQKNKPPHHVNTEILTFKMPRLTESREILPLIHITCSSQGQYVKLIFKIILDHFQ